MIGPTFIHPPVYQIEVRFRENIRGWAMIDSRIDLILYLGSAGMSKSSCSSKCRHGVPTGADEDFKSPPDTRGIMYCGEV